MTTQSTMYRLGIGIRPLIALAFCLLLSMGIGLAVGQPSTDKAPGDAQPPKSEGAEAKEEDKKPADEEQANTADEHPYPRSQIAPSLDGGTGWINSAGPIDLKQLRGKFVVLDFWTYCCINCIHTLPELKKLEKAYPNNVVVIGVHSAKFDAEKDADNIASAVHRYEIEHPIINDANMVVWDKYQATGWPAIRVVDPEGRLIAGAGGEIPFEVLDAFFKKNLPIYRQRGSLDETPLHFNAPADSSIGSPLRFPGKILADETSERLFVADSNHNRIVVATLGGKLIEVIGDGQIGSTDGAYGEARFDHPQGMALAGNSLYVADTENHLIRKIDLAAKRVSTVAGTGRSARLRFEGLDPLTRLGKPSEAALSSPWALAIHEKGLYIAMAGMHQIWLMPLDESTIGPFAGTSAEDIIDGLSIRHKGAVNKSFAAFAQPSGLASDGRKLYVADSEGSSIRAVDFDLQGETTTIVGTAHLPFARLFTFGDQDGQGQKVRLQHALGVTFHDGYLYVADTYNNKIKKIDPAKQTSLTIAGTGKPGADDDPATFDEPAGITYAAGKLFVADTNNHRIRTIDLKNNARVATLAIEGLTPPAPPKVDQRPDLSNAVPLEAQPVRIAPDAKALSLRFKISLPAGWKPNQLAPTNCYIEAVSADENNEPATVMRSQEAIWQTDHWQIDAPLSGERNSTKWRVLLTFYYCQEGSEGLCKVAQVVWTTPISFDGEAGAKTATFEHSVE